MAPRRGNWRRRAGRRSSGNSGRMQMTYPVAVVPMAVNWTKTTSATENHDLDPASLINKDVIYRASSTTVEVCCVQPQGFQILLFAGSTEELATCTFTVGSTPRRFHVRAPRHLDYNSKTFWRYVLTGPGRVSGLATFTLKNSLDAITLKAEPSEPPDSGSSSIVVL